MIERGGKVRLKSVPNAQEDTILPIIHSNLETGTFVMTDGNNIYLGLGKTYKGHESVNHAQGEYKRGEAHTNSIEGFFSILKRGIYGIYHHASSKHLGKYCDEFSFRFNMRKDTQTERFNAALHQNTTRYRELIGKEVKNG
jgi:transposase-like protein